MNIQEIKRNISISSIIGKYITLKGAPNKLKGLCPFHKDSHPSLLVQDDRGTYHCFTCDADGDVFKFLMNYLDKKFLEAKAMLENGSFAKDVTPPVQPVEFKTEEVKYSEYIQIFPAPESAPKLEAGKASKILVPAWVGNPHKQYSKTKWDQAHAYKNLQGELLGYVVRKYEKPQPGQKKQKKNDFPVTWCEKPDGTEGWVMKGFPSPRLPYLIETLPKDLDQEVYFTMGEAKALSCARLAKVCTLSWPGGDNAFNKVDFLKTTPYKITIWPDNDKSAIEAANKLAEHLSSLGCQQIKLIQYPKSWPQKWDAKNAEEEKWDFDRTTLWLTDNSITYPEKITHHEEEIAEQKDLSAEKAEAAEERKYFKNSDDIHSEHFRILGYNNSHFYYINEGFQQPLDLTPMTHTEPYLQMLADPAFWQTYFGGPRGIDLTRVREYLYGKAKQAGVFFPHKGKVGRGARIIEGKKIFNYGNKVMVDGEDYIPFKVPLKKFFHLMDPIEIPAKAPLTDEESRKVIKLSERFSWDNKLSGKLVAGWCVIAPVCGMLEWRPHLWITGQSNSGKSTVLDEFINKLTQHFNIVCTGKTTEPYLRNRIDNDAIPVLMEESEKSTKDTQRLLNAILDYIRDSSRGGDIGKMGIDGTPKTFTVRSIFCLCSINPTIKGTRDITRITRIVMKKNQEADYKKVFEKLQKDLYETLTPEFSAALLLRTIKNIDVLYENTQTFIRAGMEVFNDKRDAEQLAPMLAGYNLCNNTNLISLTDAKKMIERHSWDDHIPKDAEKDVDTLLSTILTYPTTLTVNGKLVKTSIGELIIDVASGSYDKEQKKHLGGFGLKIEENKLLISNTSVPMATQILEKTVWNEGWIDHLITLTGAERVTEIKDGKNKMRTVHFCPGIKTNAISIPLSLIQEESESIKQVSQVVEDEEIDFETAF